MTLASNIARTEARQARWLAEADNDMALIRHFCDKRGIAVRDFLGSTRLPHIVAARKAYARHLYQQRIPKAEIGRIMRKHHTSIMHYLRGQL